MGTETGTATGTAKATETAVAGTHSAETGTTRSTAGWRFGGAWLEASGDVVNEEARAARDLVGTIVPLACGAG